MTFILAEDAALKSHLSGITVSDEKNPNRPVNVWFGYPDVEIRTQNYPFITIELIDIRHAIERQHSGYYYDSDRQGTQAPVANNLYGYEVPVAYDIVYQVTSHSRHPRHDRALAFQLMHKFPAMRGYLAVPNALGTSTAQRHMFMEDFVKLDRAEGENGNKRTLRNIYTVRVVSEMTPAQAADALVGVETVYVDLQYPAETLSV
jgi:hypothetical protein